MRNLRDKLTKIELKKEFEINIQCFNQFKYFYYNIL